MNRLCDPPRLIVGFFCTVARQLHACQQTDTAGYVTANSEKISVLLSVLQLKFLKLAALDKDKLIGMRTDEAPSWQLCCAVLQYFLFTVPWIHRVNEVVNI